LRDIAGNCCPPRKKTGGSIRDQDSRARRRRKPMNSNGSGGGGEKRKKDSPTQPDLTTRTKPGKIVIKVALEGKKKKRTRKVINPRTKKGDKG